MKRPHVTLSAQSPAAEYRDYLAFSPRWRAIRTLALWLAQGRCRMCGRLATEVHHRDYKHRGRGGVVGAWRELLDVTPLCRPCHAGYHEKEG
jgi:hypothetical protein